MSLTQRTEELAFSDVIPIVPTTPKPRTVGMTEIRDRGLGMHYVQDLVETLGDHIDVLKWASGAQCAFRREFVRTKNRYLRQHDIEVSTGGLLERVMLQGEDAVYRFLDECRDLEFSAVEISSGMVVLSLADKVALTRAVLNAGLKPKPEVGMAYGLRPGETVQVDADRIIHECEVYLEAGAWKVTLEEEGLFEGVENWRTDVVHKLCSKVPVDKIIFEASEVHTFNWFVYNYGHDVNLFVDHSQLTQLFAARAGVWGKKDIWGRVSGFRGRS